MIGEDRRPLSILLAHGEDRDEPCLPIGVPAAALATAPRLELRQEESALDFGNEASDPSSLPERRWGLVLPREESLRQALLSALQPLIAHRAAQVGYESAAELLASDVFLVESDPELSEQDAEQWYQQCYKQEGEHELLRRDPLERPDYLLLLGDLHQVPESIHRVLGQSGCFVGRLAFSKPDGSPNLDGYRCYAEKLVAAERRTSGSGRASAGVFVVEDGTAATQLAAQKLTSPLLERARAAGPRFKCLEINTPEGAALHSRDQLWRLAAGLPRGVLMTVSHGYGGPRGGFLSGAGQRAQQGAMSFLHGEPRLDAGDAAAHPQGFLAGGVWLMFACYGAGTPARSHYHRWLCQRKDWLPARSSWVLDALPRSGADFRPFIAALPQVLLSREDGPVAFIGHLDLAWSYSFQTPGGGADPDLFRCLLGALLQRARVGAAFQFLQRKLREIEGALISTYHLQAEVERHPEAAAKLWSPARERRLQELWMMRQDLAGFVVLGDPAAELPI